MPKSKNKGLTPKITTKTPALAPEGGYLSISQAAAKVPGYSADYLSLRVRQGKLRGRKIGRNWYTKLEWIHAYIRTYGVKDVVAPPVQPVPKRDGAPEHARAKGGYLSIAQASTHVPGYSADYLSLRVRQGKLRGRKIGRNWYTRREWIAEYLTRYAAKDVSLLPLTPTRSSRSGMFRRRLSQFGRAFAPARFVAATLTATVVLLFVVPPQAWAHWGMSASLSLGRSFTFAFSGTKNLASSLSRDPRFTGTLSQLERSVSLAAASRSAITRTPRLFSEHVAARFGFDTSERAPWWPFWSDRDGYGSRLGRDGRGGAVAGDETVRTLAPDSFSLSSVLATITRATGKALTFANPNDPFTIITRLSGGAREFSGSFTRLNLASGISRSVSKLSSRINVTSILQPANQYAVSLPVSPSSPDVRIRSVPAVGNGIVEPAPREASGAPRSDVVLGPSRLVTSSQGTLMVGSLPLQSAAHTFTNQGDPSSTVLQVASTGPGAILQGVSQSGDIVFSVSDAGVLKVGASPDQVRGRLSTVIDRNSVTTVTVAAGTVRTATLSVSGPAIFSSRLTAKDAGVTGTLTVGGNTVLSGAVSVAGDLRALANLIVDAALSTASLTVSGTTTLRGPVTAEGEITVNAPLRVNATLTAKTAVVTGSLSVAGDTTLSDNTTVGGNLTVLRNLTVAGTFSPQAVVASGPVSGYSVGGIFGSFDQLNAEDASFGGSDNDIFLVNSQATFGSSATFNAGLTAASSLTVAGATTLQSTLSVTGASTLSSTLNVTGNTTVGGSLTVTGATAFNGGFSLSGAQTVTATSTEALVVKDDTTTYLAVDTVHGRMVLTSTATSSPSFALTQSGDAPALSITQSSTTATTTAEIVAATSTALSLTTQSGSASSTLALYQQGTGNILDVFDGATNVFTILDGGSIGISSSTPWGLLSVNAPGGQPSLVVGSSSTQLIVDESGSIGIGTSSPSSLLAIQDVAHFRTGTSTFEDNLQVDGGLQVGTGSTYIDSNTIETSGNLAVTSTTATSTLSTGGFTVGTDDFVVQQTSGQVGIGSTTPWGLLSVNAPGGQPSLVVGSSSTQLIVDESGSIGIGTSSPSSLLAIQDVAHFRTGTSTFEDNLQVDGGLQVGTGSTYIDSNTIETSGNLAVTSTTATSTLSTGGFTVGTDDFVVQQTSGQVGIGSTTPWGLLSIHAPSGIPSFVVGSSTTQLIVDESGNFGVGTTSPGAFLDVQGAAQFGSGNVDLIDSTGRVAGISSTYFASLDGSTLTSLNGSNVSSGTVADARIASALTSKTYDGLTVATGTNTFTLTRGSADLVRSGAHSLTLTTSASTNVTFPTSGTLTTTTGSGASGTWGISISGNAATVTSGVYTTGDQTVGGAKTFSSQIVSSVAGGTAPLSITSTTKVTNLNADLLDGSDSSAFGDATAANQTTILGRIGTNADAASLADTLFAGQQYIWDNRASFTSQSQSQTFTSSGTWSRPAGTTLVWVTMVGGGGGGGGGEASGAGGGGGGGGGATVWRKPVTVSGDVTVTVGSAGSAGGGNTNGGDGSSSSFGSESAPAGSLGYGGTDPENGGAGGGIVTAVTSGTSGVGGAGGTQNGTIDGSAGTAAGWYIGGGGGGTGVGTSQGTAGYGGAVGIYKGGDRGGSGNGMGGGGGATMFGVGANGDTDGGAGGSGAAGAANTGAGGGGGSGNSAGGAGGSGTVIVEWIDA